MNNHDYEENFKDKNLTFSYDVGRHEIIKNIKIILFYIFEIVFWLVVSKLYMSFGKLYINPAVSIMWIIGALTVFIVKEEREGTISETKWTILAYLAFLLLYRIFIQLLAPISSDQMGAALNINIPAASGQVVAGTLQNLLLIISAMVPIGFLIWCGQKVRTYRGKNTKQATFRKIKDIRNK